MGRKYTVAVHVSRLKKMLNKFCTPLEARCPAARGFNSRNRAQEMWDKETIPCYVCKTFVGIGFSEPICPCAFYGKETVILETMDAIKKYEESFSARGKKSFKKNPNNLL